MIVSNASCISKGEIFIIYYLLTIVFLTGKQPVGYKLCLADLVVILFRRNVLDRWFPCYKFSRLSKEKK